MCEAVKETKDTAQEKNCSLRIAAYVNAIRRVNEQQLSGHIGI
jgi:hypothetical protein